MIKGNHFNLPRSGVDIKVKEKITCSTKYVVYLLKCPCCIYHVGKTKQELKNLILYESSDWLSNAAVGGASAAVRPLVELKTAVWSRKCRKNWIIFSSRKRLNFVSFDFEGIDDV